MSIQLVSRARQAGLLITPRAVFQHQTVAALAAAAALGRRRPHPRVPDIATGGLPATPIMRWLLERGGPIDRFSQAMLLQVPAGLGEDHLVGCAAGAARSSRCVAAACLRLRRRKRRRSTLEIAPAGAVTRSACLRRVDVCGLDDAALRRCIAERGAAAGRRLAPAAGVMVQAVWFDAGADAAGRLLLSDPSSGGRRGVVAHPGAGPCGGVGGGGERRDAGAAAARDLVPALGATAAGARRRMRSRRRRACVLARDAERAGAVAGGRRARSRARSRRQRPGS